MGAREEAARYQVLFEANPLPMWVFDAETLAFLAVNDAAVAHYGYSRDEFLAMTIQDIRPREDVPRLLAVRADRREGRTALPGSFRHRRKDGSLLDVEVTTHTLRFAGRPAELVLRTTSPSGCVRSSRCARARRGAHGSRPTSPGWCTSSRSPPTARRPTST